MCIKVRWSRTPMQAHLCQCVHLTAWVPMPITDNSAKQAIWWLVYMLSLHECSVTEGHFYISGQWCAPSHWCSVVGVGKGPCLLVSMWKSLYWHQWQIALYSLLSVERGPSSLVLVVTYLMQVLSLDTLCTRSTIVPSGLYNRTGRWQGYFIYWTNLGHHLTTEVLGPITGWATHTYNGHQDLRDYCAPVQLICPPLYMQLCIIW